jgi:putative transposase
MRKRRSTARSPNAPRRLLTHGNRGAFGLRVLQHRFSAEPRRNSAFNHGPLLRISGMNSDSIPTPPDTFRLPPVRLIDLKSQLPPKNWLHAPVHRLAENAVYFVTASTLHKQHFFSTPEKRDLLERLLLTLAKHHGWQLEAWAMFSNHYHIVVRGQHDSKNFGEFLHRLHGVSAHDLNALDGAQGRQVWFNFRDTKLTIQHSYLARLNYVHQNAVKHRLAPVANQYPWCSAAWFERVASPAQVKMIYGFKTDGVKVEDDF